MKWVRYGLWETASKGRRECMDLCRIDVTEELGRYVVTEQNVRKLAGFLKTLEYWQIDKFWDLVSRFLILYLEMLETSALGLGQDLRLLLVLEALLSLCRMYESHLYEMAKSV
ncbi:hypothetical protein F2Q69_00048518 [Brassica cretica]|uniref:Uncharacterized protein n=1 Tax=Brassica cretica TaxID=69181 RepID=A0A8S9PM17_BRACR|nr:hypothetical protein F2Q69_00048518 [Brassica cretica]